MLLIFLGIYIYILSYDKIILFGASLPDVIEALDQYLIESGRNYRIYPINEFTSMVEINNYRNALTVRDADKWIEIDNHIHYDEAFIRLWVFYFGYCEGGFLERTIGVVQVTAVKPDNTDTLHFSDLPAAGTLTA